jgi:hypothetical protein
VRLLLGASAGGALGAVDRLGPVLQLRVGVRVGRWSIAAEARVDFPVERTLAGLADARVASSALGASLVACAHFDFAAACALVGAGGLYRSASGVAEPTPGADPWAFAGARGALVWPVSSRWSLLAAADALAAIVRPVPSLRDDRGQSVALWQPWPVHLAVTLGAQVSLH